MKKFYLFLLGVLILLYCVGCNKSTPLEPLINNAPLEQVLPNRDLIVFAKYKNSVFHFKYTEYVFEITEIFLGECDTTEISVFSEKENLFSKDERAKLLNKWDSEYKADTEYLLVLDKDTETYSGDALVWSIRMHVETMNIESDKYSSGFFLSTGLSTEATREDLKQYLIDILKDKSTNSTNEQPIE